MSNILSHGDSPPCASPSNAISFDTLVSDNSYLLCFHVGLSRCCHNSYTSCLSHLYDTISGAIVPPTSAHMPPVDAVASFTNNVTVASPMPPSNVLPSYSVGSLAPMTVSSVPSVSQITATVLVSPNSSGLTPAYGQPSCDQSSNTQSISTHQLHAESTVSQMSTPLSRL